MKGRNKKKVIEGVGGSEIYDVLVKGLEKLGEGVSSIEEYKSSVIEYVKDFLLGRVSGVRLYEGDRRYGNEIKDVLMRGMGLSFDNLLNYEEIREHYLRLIEELRSLENVQSIDDFRRVVLRYLQFTLLYGSAGEKAGLVRELMKYLFPTKREDDMRFSGGITFLVNKEIEDEEGYVDRDKLSEDGDESEG